MLMRCADCSRSPSQKRKIAKTSLAGSKEGARWTELPRQKTKIRKWVVALFILLNSVFPHYQDMELSYPSYSAPYDQSILSSLRAPTCLLLRHRIEKNKKTAEAVWSKSVF